MSGLKKALSITIALLILTTVAPVVSASAIEQPLWSAASPYMLQELADAQALGLIPEIMNDSDFTKPVTRLEFAHLAVLMCETYAGVATNPRNGNPFSDTDDPYVLKAYCYGLMLAAKASFDGHAENADSGTADSDAAGSDDASNEPADSNSAGDDATAFAPDLLLTREEMAYAFYRIINIIAPLADYTVPTQPVIPDFQETSQWAQSAVKYLYSQQIVKGGSNGEFMPGPRDGASANPSSAYGLATREQCIVLAARVYKALPVILSTRFSIEDKAAEILALADDEPENGTEVTNTEFYTLFQPLARKIRHADNMHATSFLGDYLKTGDNAWRQGYDSAFLFNTFSAIDLSHYKYDEQQTLWGASAGMSRYALSVFDNDLKVLSTLEWNSESDIGSRNAAPMQSFSLFSPLSLSSYLTGRAGWVYRIYPDEVFAGEWCKVFSVTRKESMIEQDAVPESGRPPEVFREITEYFYISEVSGLCMAIKHYATVGDTVYQSIQITFSISPSLTDASKIAPPPEITFGG